MIKAGDLDQRVTLQSRAATINAIGEPVGVWSDVVTVWANIRDLSAREIHTARAVQVESVRRVTIRWRPGITADMRLLHQGRIMVLTAPPREVGRKQWLELDVAEGLSDV